MIAAALSVPFALGAGLFWAFTPWITPAGPGRWRLGPKSRFAKGRAVFLRRAGAILVHDDAGGVHALSGVCTHQGCTLSVRNARKRITCPCHGAAFDFQGAVTNPPAQIPLARLTVLEEDGELFLETIER